MLRSLLVVICLFIAMSLPAQTIVQRDTAIAALVQEVNADSLRSYIDALVRFGTRNTLSTQTDKSRGIGAARQWVLKKFNEFAKYSNGRMTAIIDTTTVTADGRRVDAPIVLGNVMATLKGSDASDKRIFVIGGHLDSRRTDVMDRTGDAPGANDDGSGVAALIECARVMSRQSYPATIIFVAFSGEEQGLLGAHLMARRAKEQDQLIVAVLNNDMVGSNNSNETNIINNTQVRVFSEGIPMYETEKQIKKIMSLGLENDSKSRQLARYVKETGERYVDNLEVKLVYRTDRFLRGGDHLPFLQNGYTAVRITEMNENYHHQHQDIRTENGIEYGDLARFMDFEYLRKNTALNLSVLANLAKAPAVPADVKIQVTTLTNYSTITWAPPEYGTAKGYYVLIRETASPLWQKKILTTNQKITLPYSKDNYLFAVQSVSQNGNESLAVMPSVGRD